MTNSITPVIEARELCMSYDEAGHTLNVLDQASLQVAAAEMLAIVGASGSGKSTLLHILSLLDRPTSGQLFIQGQDTAGLSENQRSQVRNQVLGFVYQFHHLLPEFTALDNVAMPLIIRRIKRDEARQRAQTLLEQVGLGARIEHFPSQLSGGERQRVAIARALVSEPACILADEPTGNLDTHTAEEVFELLRTACRQHQTAFVIVTHDPSLAARTDRVLTMSDGRLEGVTSEPAL